ncbi:single-stranded DNA-binding protein [Sulfurimonas sp. HSL-1656]|uniref:single-stranded DNA-binding protein n=1 Tax=Thiomicrolovo subterrani TaxID=3131934 RepID=UPI0031F9E922
MFNKVILAGNLTRDIELRYTQGGTAIGKTGIATNRKFKKQSGEQVDETMFIDIVFFGRSAEIANQYLRNGSKVLIEGRLMLEQWTDQGGQKRSKHSINVEEMKMLDSRGDAQQGNGGYNAPSSQEYNAPQQGYTPPPQPQNAYDCPMTPPRDPGAGSGHQQPGFDIDEDEIPF